MSNLYQAPPLTNTLWVELHITARRVQEIVIQSQRLRLPSQLLVNKPLATVPKLVGMLFSVCANAQTIAALCATQQACAQTISPQTTAHYQQQVVIESLFEHLLRLSQTWPQALSIQPLAAEHLQQLFQLKRRLNATPFAASIEPTLKLLTAWLEQHYLGLSLTTWLQAVTQGDRALLSRHGLSGQLLQAIQTRQWQTLGNTPCSFLPLLSANWWHEQLNSELAESFLAQPTLNGLACETSSLSRHWQHPALAGWRSAYGYGLITRWLARVLDLIDNLQTLQAQASADFNLASPPHTGLAAINTARGLLIHRVVQTQGLIQHYQVLAPTEWNFHPQGSLYRMLSVLEFKDEADLRAQAGALITALDPCVSYHLEIKPYA